MISAPMYGAGIGEGRRSPMQAPSPDARFNATQCVSPRPWTLSHTPARGVDRHLPSPTRAGPAAGTGLERAAGTDRPVGRHRADGTPCRVSILVTPELAAQVHAVVDPQRPLRAHDSQQYARRLMVRFDEDTWQRLQTLAQRADCSAA